ncbi:hypothetical protein FDECE_18126 [Fusarium decemcellulare]|nr:hypothetical protein FDECE_18126 [Fusarium decemcellulare]
MASLIPTSTKPKARWLNLFSPLLTSPVSLVLDMRNRTAPLETMEDQVVGLADETPQDFNAHEHRPSVECYPKDLPVAQDTLPDWVDYTSSLGVNHTMSLDLFSHPPPHGSHETTQSSLNELNGISSGSLCNPQPTTENATSSLAGGTNPDIFRGDFTHGMMGNWFNPQEPESSIGGLAWTQQTATSLTADPELAYDKAPTSSLGTQQLDNLIPGLPRRRSRYSLAFLPDGDPTPTVAYLGPSQDPDPLQRWRDSPPETEAVALSAISDALQNTPLGGECDTGQSRRGQSSPSIDSRLSHSSSSIASTRSSISGIFRPLRASTGRVAKKGSSRRLNDAPRIFSCTFCCDSFRKKHDWTRHEKSLHLNCDQWVCAPYGGTIVSPITLRSHCAYCNMLDPTNEHVEAHNHSACHNQVHVFRRKDHLVQHLRGFHQLDSLPIIEDWKINPPVITARCGFCGARLESWQARADHLTTHFREGKTMKDWTGDHEFEPSIAAQIKNALPPYLLADEAKTVVPFSATDPRVPDHLSQMTQGHQGLLDAANQGDGMPQTPGFNPTFEVTPTSYTRYLAWHLGRFAQQNIATGIFPTDQMFQDEARRLVYGNDDNWEQTIADNGEWLASFRRQHLDEQ